MATAQAWKVLNTDPGGDGGFPHLDIHLPGGIRVFSACTALMFVKGHTEQEFLELPGLQPPRRRACCLPQSPITTHKKKGPPFKEEPRIRLARINAPHTAQ